MNLLQIKILLKVVLIEWWALNFCQEFSQNNSLHSLENILWLWFEIGFIDIKHPSSIHIHIDIIIIVVVIIVIVVVVVIVVVNIVVDHISSQAKEC